MIARLAPRPAERRAFHAIRGAVPESAAPALRTVAQLGGHPVVWPLAIGAAAAGYLGRRRLRDAAAPIAWLAGTTLSRRLVADAVRRQRPDRRCWRSHASGFCYPSRHTTLATVGWGLAAGCLPPRYARPAKAVAVTVAVAVGLTRVPLGVHWPGDVLAGWAFGGAVLALRRMWRHHSPAPANPSGAGIPAVR